MGVQATANTVISVVFYLGLFFLFLLFLLQPTSISDTLLATSRISDILIVDTNKSYDDGSTIDVKESGSMTAQPASNSATNITISDEEDQTGMEFYSCLPNCRGGAGEKREFQGYGSGAYLFVQMSAYRGGPREFFVNGLGSKPVHVFSNASFKCEWIPSSRSANVSTSPIQGDALKMLPDWGFGRVYTVVVVRCSFGEEVGTEREGGQLVLYASPTNSSSNVQRIVAVEEKEGEYNSSKFDAPFAFDYVYCGSPLYGHINPQRIREWVAYHLNFFGPRSHLLLYDAGGIHPGVQRVLEPWIRAGRITVENVRAQEPYDGYYHNQFLIVNDCLHKTRFMANWTFFFDVDEFLYLPSTSSLESLLRENSRFTQIFFEQIPMSHRICINDSQSDYQKMWGFEKLVFRSTKKGVRLDRKYAIQPRNVFATGVHLTTNFQGKSHYIRGEKARYYHYHGTTSLRGNVCRDLINITWDHHDTIWLQKEPFIVDLSMHELASDIKKFEFDQIGEQENPL